jgi:hypothetical protein
VGLRYLKFGAAALAAGFVMSMAGAGAVLAVEPGDMVFDGTVTVHWVDPSDGPMAGASIVISYYHEGDASPVALPAATADGAGDVTVVGVPRPTEGTAPVLLDIRGDLSTATVDDAGCTTYEDWLAETIGVASGLAVEVALVSNTKGISVSCPEPTPTPVIDPTPTPTGVVDPTPTPQPTVGDPTPTPTASSTGGVLGAVGTPAVTPPSTDATDGPASLAGSPSLPASLLLAGVAVLLTPGATLAFARRESAHRRGRQRPNATR